MGPRPTSDELWGHHSMPSPCKFDVLMPNGTVLKVEFGRELSLEKAKEKIWVKAKNEVMFRFLSEPQSYIFVGVTIDAKVEEFYDEGKRLCDLRLFIPCLKLVEPQGDSEEKKLNSRISLAVGKRISDFDSHKEPEFVDCRRNLISFVHEVVREREALPLMRKLELYFPSEVEVQHDPKLTSGGRSNSTVLLKLFFKHNSKFEPLEDKFPLNMKPSHVVESLKSKLPESFGDAVLKVCAFDEYLLGDFELSQYKYINRCISQERSPELCIVPVADLMSYFQTTDLVVPSSLRRSAETTSQLQRLSMLREDIENQRLTSLWKTDEIFKVKVNLATYANARDTFSIFVKIAIYHGTELLTEPRETSKISPQSPKWQEKLEFDVPLEDIPRGSRLCIGLCAVHRKKQLPTLEAWCNQPLFDYRDYMLSGKVSLALWRATKVNELLNPMGATGSNPDKDATCLEIEFPTSRTPVVFPPEPFVQVYAEHLEKHGDTGREMGRRNSQVRNPMELTEDDKKKFDEIAKRSPLAELFQQDQDLVWRMREYCCALAPDALPKLCESVVWKNRAEVTQLYSLLKKWKPVKVETALELLDCKYTDPRVRSLAVSWLGETLSDAHISEYLLQLVHVALNEPYLDNDVSKLLLKRALFSRPIGHYLFWLLKAEIHDPFNSLRCGLLLEAFCRGIAPAQLEMLTQQVDALTKLTTLTDILKDRKDSTYKDRLALLHETVQQEDYLQALNALHSPLKFSARLGKLRIEKCRIMDSAKRPLWLVWENGDETSHLAGELQSHAIIFKNGDDLRQDMLTLQVIRIMDSIWRSESLDLKMMPYTCLATGNQVGMIEVVRNAKTVMHFQRSLGIRAAMQVGSKELHKWFERTFKDKNEAKYNQIIDTFTKSCAGYCVATFVLGIGDRNPDNIMINDEGQIFHIDFGHFLGHFKKKFGISRERVPFVLTDDFLFVICRGEELTENNIYYKGFNDLCEKAYLILRKHANLLITLFTMMLSTGIPELSSVDDVGYLRNTLQVDISDDNIAAKHFREKLIDAKTRSSYTKIDWFFHNVKHS